MQFKIISIKFPMQIKINNTTNQNLHNKNLKKKYRINLQSKITNKKSKS